MIMKSPGKRDFYICNSGKHQKNKHVLEFGRTKVLGFCSTI